jgi:uncharacterized protein
MSKRYIQAQQLLEDSYQLAWQVFESGYRPNYIVGVWRGGAPVGIAVQEFLDVLGIESDHIAIRTSSYSREGQRSKTVHVHGLSYIIRQLEAEDSLLIVDDVHDTGLSIQKAIVDLKSACKKNTPQIRIATPYYIHETEEWLVFPHELHGLSADEIRQHKPELSALINKMAPLIKG